MEQPQLHPLPGPPHPQREGFLSYIPSKPPFFQFQTAPPCPSPTCPGKPARFKLRGHTGSILVSPSNNLAVKRPLFQENLLCPPPTLFCPASPCVLWRSKFPVLSRQHAGLLRGSDSILAAGLSAGISAASFAAPKALR